MKSYGVLIFLCMLMTTILTAQADLDSPTTNLLNNPEGWVDRLVFFDDAADWESGEQRGVAVSESAKPQLVLDMNPGERFPRRGRWTSPEVETDFPFTEIIPSWNLNTPEETGVYFQIRSRDVETGEWSPWLYIGRWGKVVLRPNQDIDFDGGRVRIDELELRKPANAYQIRANLQSFSYVPENVPSITRIAAVYSGIIEDKDLRSRLNEAETPPVKWSRSIPVPFFAQGDNPDGISGSTCSPTSLSMVAWYWGKERPVLENCMSIYDPDYGMFGNWARATQRAAELGLDSWVTRVRTWDQVKSYIASGQPVIASIAFSEGEFGSNVLNRTNGHLIVVRGLTPDGDAIVNDPASKEHGEGVVYKKEELANAWFGHGGVAYIVKGEKPRSVSDSATAM